MNKDCEMEHNKFLRRFEQILELPENSINGEMLLTDIEAWDSMAILNIIALFETEIHKEIDIFDFSTAKTVDDIFDLIKSD